MTESEIMKALEKALTTSDEPIGEHFYCGLTTKIVKEVQDLINRKNADLADKDKEIERLREHTAILIPARSQGKTRFLVKKYNAVRDEVIKEFVKNADEVFKRYWGEKESVPIHDWLYVTARIMGVETDV